MIEFDSVARTYRVWRSRARGRRRRETVTAVHDLSFRIGRGEVVGLLGPNGAGKSTALKLLTGLLSPSAGRISVLGLEPMKQRRALASRIGVMFGHRIQLWWDLPLRDSFAVLREMYEVPHSQHARRLEQLVEVLDLGPLLATPVRELSLGQRVRGELAASLLHSPELVILDEPTIGLDVIAKPRLREFIRDIVAENGVTTLVTTHDLADIENLSSRLLVLDEGRLIFDGSPGDLLSKHGRHRTVVFDLDRLSPPLDLEGYDVEREGTRLSVRFPVEETNAADVIARVAAEVEIRDVTIEEPRIEEVVRGIYAERRRDKGDRLG